MINKQFVSQYTKTGGGEGNRHIFIMFCFITVSFRYTAKQMRYRSSSFYHFC